MIDRARHAALRHIAPAHHPAPAEAPKAKPVAAQPRAAASSVAQKLHTDSFEVTATAASSRSHGVAGLIHDAAHALAKASTEKVKSALKDLPDKLAKMAHDKLTEHLEKSVHEGVKHCNTSGERSRLLKQVKALQALNYGKFAHSLVHNLDAQHKALEALHARGGNRTEKVKALQDASKAVANTFTDFAKASQKYSDLRQKVEVGCKPDVNANPRGMNFQFHLPKSDLEHLRKGHPNSLPGIRLTPGGLGLGIHLQLPGVSTPPTLHLAPHPSSSAGSQLVA